MWLGCLWLNMWMAALRRHEAAGWLRKMMGGKEIEAEPSEDEFRIGLRSGIILCNVLNTLQPGAISKVFLTNPSSIISILVSALCFSMLVIHYILLNFAR